MWAYFWLELTSAQVSPMNKCIYNIANPLPHAPSEQHFRGEYFDLYGPETQTHYSEVFWQPQTIPLPPDIVERFAGKVLAITGYEVDIVRTQSAPNGTIIHEETVAPYEIYNHHFSGFMFGKGVESTLSGTIVEPHHSRLQFQVDPNVNAPLGVPRIQVFSEGNGNEHRTSFHGYASGLAQHVFSPTTWQNDIMIINTNKRLTDDLSPGHISCLVPRSSLAPPNASYSGLLECPCTTRISKILTSYKVLQTNICASLTSVTSANECTSAAQLMGLNPLASIQIIQSKLVPRGCSIDFDWVNNAWIPRFNNFSASDVACGSPLQAATELSGSTSLPSAGVEIGLKVNSSAVSLRLSGPADAWFGVAFNASKMADLPYAIIVDGYGQVSERRLGEHTAGDLLPTTVKVISSTIHNNTRTIELVRPSGAPFASMLAVIAAAGASGTMNISYHNTLKASGVVTFAQAGTVGICICRDPSSNTGSIDGQRFNSSVCAPYPTSELITKHNAICNISTYEGGLYCCHGGTFLLDADQTVPEPLDVWRMKYRFYFVDPLVVPSQNTFRVWWSTEAVNNEYDVPKSDAKCEDPKTDPEDCTYTIKSAFQGVDMFAIGNGCMVQADPNACGNVTRIREKDGGLFQLVYAAGHCHAPACMSMELWDMDKQQLLCVNAPTYYTGDLAGYFSGIPPCLWGSASEGLSTPPILRLDSNLTSIKRTNSTNGHWGVMGLWQMRAAYLS